MAWASLVWHVAEGALGIALGLTAGSIALVGFGADSFIEATAGGVVVWRFTGSRLGDACRRASERRAARLIAITFYVLAAYVIVHGVSALVLVKRAEASPLGIVLALVTLVAMPPLAIAKQRIGRRLSSCATLSESAQNMFCAYLSVALLAGLGANAAFGWWWADPAIGLVIGAVAVLEGRRSWLGEVDGC